MSKIKSLVPEDVNAFDEVDYGISGSTEIVIGA